MAGSVLSICTGMGLLDRAFIDAGFDVIPGCEIDPEKRAMYAALCGGAPLVADFADLPADLTPLVRSLLGCVGHDWFIFENVVPIDIKGAIHTRLNAMHFYRPHQSRARWFTHSGNVSPPQPVYRGNVDDLMAYSVVAGRIYGPKRGAKLQGYPEAASLPFHCITLQHGLADAVPYPLGLAWADAVKRRES